MESKLIQKKPGNRELIWSAIRQLKTFRVRDLEDKTRVHERTILSYLQVLTKAGILEKKENQHCWTRQLNQSGIYPY